MPLTQQRPGQVPAVPAPGAQATADARWPALLEARWRDRLRHLTELCVAFHESGTDAVERRQHPSLRRLLRQAVAARQALSETDAAQRRLAAGTFGWCEDCAAEIPQSSLLHAPETRYCPRCAGC
jgi:RNA polymerase-binding transcription factor DksA